MMINILSLQCNLAFAPYLSLCAAEFLAAGAIASRVVRQGGSSLILRSEADLVLRHEDRQVNLGLEDVRHYAATIRMRTEFYDVSRMQDEVVMASVGHELLLSHPQSHMWLSSSAIRSLTSAFASSSPTQAESALDGLPEWLKVSTGGGRLLLSDQRTARWVLLGEDHIRELERRLGCLRQARETAAVPQPPTITVKGLTVHLQSAFKLSLALLEFAGTGQLIPFEETTATFSLKVSACTEGIELMDADARITLTAREAGKWARIIEDELRRLRVSQVDRDGIRTVFAVTEGGYWVLQWGDEVFVSKETSIWNPPPNSVLNDTGGSLISRRTGDLLLLLSPATGACVALTESEWQSLNDS